MHTSRRRLFQLLGAAVAGVTLLPRRASADGMFSVKRVPPTVPTTEQMHVSGLALMDTDGNIASWEKFSVPVDLNPGDTLKIDFVYTHNKDA
jgi:hypothetical protein